MRPIAIPLRFLILAACVLAAGDREGAHAAGVLAIEQPGDIEVVSPTESDEVHRGLGDLVGRLHPALVHFPIAGLVALAVVDFVGLVLGREPWRQAGMVILIATMVAMLPTVATGLLRAAHMTADATEQALIVKHRTLNLVATGLAIVVLALRATRRQPLHGASRIVYLALVYLTTAVVLVAADFGGRLVYGPDYLRF